MDKFLIIGGSNIDYIATSFFRLQKRASNSGRVNICYGGVARNTCENLARLGNKCYLLTAIGSDNEGKKMKKELEDLNVNIFSPESKLPSSTYIAINNSENDLEIGICDNRIMDRLDKDFIELHHDLIDKFEFIIIDSNISQEVIDYLFDRFKNKKFLCEAISPEKVKRFKNHLSEIYLLKCNIHEAQSLIDINLVEKDLVGALFAKGIKNVVVSNKSNNIYYGNNAKDIGLVRVEEVKNFINSNGCGDALFSGIIDMFTNEHTLKQSIEFGNKMASITLMSEKSVSPEISFLRKNN